MLTTEKQVTSRQLMYILIFTCFVLKTLNLPILVSKTSGRDAYITVGIMVLIDFSIVAVLYIASKLNPDLTIREMFEKYLTKTGSRIMFGLLGLIFMLKLYLTLSQTEEYLLDNLYSDVNWIPFAFGILIFCAYSAFKGIKAIARMIELLAPIILIFIVLCLIIMASKIEYNNILPMFENGVSPIFTDINQYLFGTCDTLVYILLLGKLKFTKHYGKRLIFAFSFSLLLVVFFNICFIAFYNNLIGFQQNGRGLIDMIQYNFGAQSFSRPDIIILSIFMISLIIKSLLFAWAVYECTINCFDFQDTPVKKLIALSPMVVIISVTKLLLSRHPSLDSYLMTGVHKYPVIAISILVPVLVLIFSIVTYRKLKKAGKKPTMHAYDSTEQTRINALTKERKKAKADKLVKSK